MNNQDIQNIKVKRTKEDIRFYNRLYYAYVRKNDKYYQHYAKEYHANNKDFYKYKYQLIIWEWCLFSIETGIFASSNLFLLSINGF